MRILIVDDSPFDRELIRRTLQRNFPDAIYVEVLHEQAFVEALQDPDYAFVCTDYYLKWTTGLDILHAIRAHSADLPVLMVTDTGSEEIAAEAMKNGLNDYVLKSHLTRLPIAIAECLQRRQMEIERRALQAQLQQVQKLESLGLLVSGISHDFNNLLAGIRGYAERGMMHEPSPKPPFDEYFRHIYARAEQGARITRQLLTFARGAPLEPSHVRLNELIASLIDLLRTLLGTSIQVTFQADPAVQTIYADSTQLEQVVMNLCLNARDAMPAGGSLEISTQQIEVAEGQQHIAPYLPPGTYVSVRISDTGVGMDEQTQARLFEPFFSTKEKGKGTGLGLAVVYGIVKQHHGVIRVESQPDQGTNFSLYFPASEAELEQELEQEGKQPEPTMSPTTTPTTGGEHSGVILLVEDDTDIQSIVLDILQDMGCTVLVASDAETAVHLFEQHAPSIGLVITDIMMPNMRNTSVQDYVRQRQEDMKILVMSGYQEIELKHRNLLDPKSVFLQKPFDLDQFIATVRRLLAKTQG